MAGALAKFFIRAASRRATTLLLMLMVKAVRGCVMLLVAAAKTTDRPFQTPAGARFAWHISGTDFVRRQVRTR